MFTKVARLVRRDNSAFDHMRKDGEPEHHDGMILGVTMKSGEQFFKPGVVYEITECMGELTIKLIGKTAMESEKWGHDIGVIMETYTDQLFLTEKEFKSLPKEE